MSVAAHFDLDIEQMDAVTEFLLAYLSEEIYMEHPERMGDQAIDNVCKLNKSIYGLKQASREWNKKLSQALKGMELKPKVKTLSMYQRSKIFYVDDIQFFSNNSKLKDGSKKFIDEVFGGGNVGLRITR